MSLKDIWYKVNYLVYGDFNNSYRSFISDKLFESFGLRMTPNKRRVFLKKYVKNNIFSAYVGENITRSSTMPVYTKSPRKTIPNTYGIYTKDMTQRERAAFIEENREKDKEEKITKELTEKRKNWRLRGRR